MTTKSASVRNFVPMASKYDRIILLVDMDCFYCQVEEKLNPFLKNKPLAVVQYNAWKGGGIIAVNYAARAKGVTRHMRGDEAKEQCPEIQLVRVPNVREKADLTKYREAGKEVANVLQRFTPLLERASVDEAYLDITSAVNKRLHEMNEGTFILRPQELENTYAVGFETIGDFVTTVTTSFIFNPLEDNNTYFRNYNENDIPAVRQSNIRLLIGASIANEIRCAVKSETLFECSAGIAHNKVLAKLACGINKPNKQTILPLGHINELFETLPIAKIKGLGAKFGEEICDILNVRYVGQLLKFTEVELQRKFDEKNGTWLYNICRGIDLEAVTPRFYSKSIGCCKKFPGRNSISGLKTLQHWLMELANEINDRLEKDICENNRRAKQMVVNFVQDVNGEEVSSSRSAPLQCYDIEILAKTSLEIIKTNTKQFLRSGSESALNNPIKFLGISVGKFETISNSQNNIEEMFAQQAAKKQKLQHVKSNAQETSLSIKNLVDDDTNPESKKINESCSSPVSKNFRSFFANALKKEKHNENENMSTTKEDNNKLPLKVFHKFECNSNKQANIKGLSSNELTTSTNDTHYNNSAFVTQQNSFFAKALRRKEETRTDAAASDLTIEAFDSNILNQNTERNDSSLEAPNETNSVQYEENIKNLRTQKEDKCNISTNNSIVSDTAMVLKPSEQICNVLCVKRTHELSKTTYESEYAEFALPELKPEFLHFTNCSKCNAKILNDPVSMQTHKDHHYAQELSKQQRNDFRAEVRLKINSSKSPPNNISTKKTKKVHLLNSTAKKSSSVDIKKFLKTSNSVSPTTLTSDQNQFPESSTSNTQICDICELPIKVENYFEHKDFHMAKDLQRKLNQLDVRTVEIIKNSPSRSRRKSKKLPMNTSPRKSKVTAKTITQFFAQPNM